MRRRWWLRVLLGLIALLIVLSVALAFSLGAIVKKSVERIGPNATKVEVRLKSAQVWLLAGRVQLDDFFLGNPAGFKMPSAIEVDSISVRVQPASVLSDRLVVESLTIKNPIMTLEGGLKNNNLTQIEKNLNDYAGAPAAPAAETKAAPSSAATPDKKMQINDLIISGAKLQINTAFSGGKTILAPIPDIHLTDLGSGAEGITAVEVGRRVLDAMVTAATKTALRDAGDLGQEAIGEVKVEGKKIDVHKIVGKLKGLFQ